MARKPAPRRVHMSHHRKLGLVDFKCPYCAASVARNRFSVHLSYKHGLRGARGTLRGLSRGSVARHGDGGELRIGITHGCDLSRLVAAVAPGAARGSES